MAEEYATQCAIAEHVIKGYGVMLSSLVSQLLEGDVGCSPRNVDNVFRRDTVTEDLRYMDLWFRRFVVSPRS